MSSRRSWRPAPAGTCSCELGVRVRSYDDATRPARWETGPPRRLAASGLGRVDDRAEVMRTARLVEQPARRPELHVHPREAGRLHRADERGHVRRPPVRHVAVELGAWEEAP